MPSRRSRGSRGEASTLCSIVGSMSPDASSVGSAFKLATARRRSTNTKHQSSVQTRSTRTLCKRSSCPASEDFGA
jgi:hypothetical protein